MTEVETPTVLLKWAQAKENINRMLSRAKAWGLRLRPHLKTAQCLEIARYFEAQGVKQFTCSSFSMAAYFAKGGLKDLTVAFPVNVREMQLIDALASQIRLNILAVNAESLALLRKDLRHPCGVFLKIDTGSHRTGLQPGDEAGIEACLQEIERSKHLSFKGFLAHAGHSYAARSRQEILRVHQASTNILRQLKSIYRPRFPHLEISTGDTPTCSVADSGWEDIDEIRPGNFVFYDLMQVAIGSCRMEDLAVALACPVVALHPERHEAIVYGGGVHLSKERMWWHNQEIYGLPVELCPAGWKLPQPGNFVRSLSQEHGVLHCTPAFFEKLRIGGLVGVLPVHSCMMVDIAPAYLLTTGGALWEKYHSCSSKKLK